MMRLLPRSCLSHAGEPNQSSDAAIAEKENSKLQVCGPGTDSRKLRQPERTMVEAVPRALEY
jgi:hypothetical protein